MSRRLSDLYPDWQNRLRQLTVALGAANRDQAEFWQLVMMRDAKWKNHTWRARRSLQAIPQVDDEQGMRAWSIVLTHDYASIGSEGAGADGYPNYFARLEEKTFPRAGFLGIIRPTADLMRPRFLAVMRETVQRVLAT
jgi:hypothetical protein